LDASGERDADKSCFFQRRSETPTDGLASAGIDMGPAPKEHRYRR
jgi:hypothetical protein